MFLEDVLRKYKKPLCLPFVDFTSRVEGLVACQHDVEHNAV